MSEDQENGIIEIGEIRNLSRTVSDKLQEMIYTGRLKPGERLVQTELAERFRVSRVAIRDALQELRQSGLAVINSQNGGMDRPAGIDAGSTEHRLCAGGNRAADRG